MTFDEKNMNIVSDFYPIAYDSVFYDLGNKDFQSGGKGFK
jgi:hypothetical protein